MSELDEFRTIDLSDKAQRQEWEQLVRSTGLPQPRPGSVAELELTLGAKPGDRLTATGSIAGDRIEFVAIAESERAGGAAFNRLITELLHEQAERGRFHVFVSTKPGYRTAFTHIGFDVLAADDHGVLMETGDRRIGAYLAQLAPLAARPGERLGAVVMHANPFTRGHRHLIETALEDCDRVIVFVLADDAALFSASERRALVETGTADLGDRVNVVSGDDYLVSAVTFPAYFIDDASAAARYQCRLDAQIFRERIAPALGIGTRFLGEEPASPTTAIYNEVLSEQLPPSVQVRIIPRLQTAAGDVISASSVRARIAAGEFAGLDAMLPPTTAAFVRAHADELSQRIRASHASELPIRTNEEIGR